ncbi:MAG: glycosyltransferase family 4 protein [Sulfuricaulis sp.]|uniref:MraY family glycosyltransferase n=1 Tax=Sulfuricaulis sp. TaxID=2003553 RepID=UPI0025F920D5|nr:glycosyltransferase family 4 protein [Sulfuricaulis sp.]MCR4347998.1 glycosyltransferase family 4 protein [Sulfuricaulis sp.]
MNLLVVTVLTAMAFVLSALLTRLCLSPGSVVFVLDYPNDRSLHDRPVPRNGGLAILIAIIIIGLASDFFRPVQGYAGIMSGILIVAAVSFLDDRYSVPPIYRLTAHMLAAAAILYSGFIPHRFEAPGTIMDLSYPVGVSLSVLFIVWMINLYNFMDGMDGFAGGMAVFGFGIFAIMGWTAGHDAFLAVSLIIAAASAGFLFFNFPPARIFMGDVGSSTLGLLAATLSLWGARDGIFPFWIALLVFSPFIVDATVTLFRRLLRGDKIWQAHKTHFYQRLVQAGWGHRKTVLWEYVLMAACAGSAIWVVRQTETVQWWTIGFWTMVYALLIAMVRRLEAGNLRTRKEDHRA